MANAKLSVTGINIGLVVGQDRSVYVTWNFPAAKQKQTEKYEVKWYYLTNTVATNNAQAAKWFLGGTNDVTNASLLRDTYSAPANASSVYASITPVSKTHGKKNKKYWSSKGASSAPLTFSQITTPPSGPTPQGGVGNITFYKIGGSGKSVQAIWSWDKNDTSGYEVEWQYKIGGSDWISGSTSTVTTKSAVYDIPDKATQIQVRVKPKAEDENKWQANWSAWYQFNPTGPTPAGAVSSVTFSQVDTIGRTLQARWSWSKGGTEGYEVEWQYLVGSSDWISGTSSTVTITNTTYDVPDRATTVRFRVKPKAKDEEWAANWSGWFQYNPSNLIPAVPGVPDVTIEKYTLTAVVEISESAASKIEFQIVQDDTVIFNQGIQAAVKLERAAAKANISAGHGYKVKARSISSVGKKSEWSGYSSTVYSLPSPPSDFTSIKAISATQVRLTWKGSSYADSYIIEWTNKKEYFDTAHDQVHSQTITEGTTAIITTGEDGDTWFFRCKASKDGIESSWNKIAQVATGKKPAIPTTWSLKTVLDVGEDAILYWMHNSQDNSSQTTAQIQVTINGQTRTITVENTRPDDDKDKTSSYNLSTASLVEGATINWKVRTKGVIDEYSEWSITRTIKVYAPPTIQFIFGITRRWIWDPFNFNTDSVYSAKAIPIAYSDTLTTLPIDICCKAGPDTQNALNFTVVVTALNSYETTDEDGTTTKVNENEDIFTEVVNPETSETLHNHMLRTLSASDITLEDGMSYRLTCTVAMDTGLTATCFTEFRVHWADVFMYPNAEIAINEDDYTAYITPYCENAEDERIDDVLLSVYRRDYDGGFTEISDDLPSKFNMTVTDPHPSLDYLRYRIVAKDLKTGQIVYNDITEDSFEDKSIIIQWDEDWSEFYDSEIDTDPVDRPWTGSLLRLPYNIEIQENSDPDKELVEYIGRAHPVSYYGTQKGESATWNTVFDKYDVETLYAVRRLKSFLGDCYVREPSGSGYWANITVSYSRKYVDPLIPVTFTITRVEGGA